MAKRNEIALRLREFGDTHYESLAQFGRALKLSPQALNVYLSGRSNPGNVIQARLRELGCDLDWLNTGMKRGATKDSLKLDGKINVDAEIVAQMRYMLLTTGRFELDMVAKKVGTSSDLLRAILDGERPLPLSLLVKLVVATQDLTPLLLVLNGTGIGVKWSKVQIGRKVRILSHQ